MVPEYGVVGGRVVVTCMYDLQNKQLYSLKWYHNNTEFYRYVPTERKGPVMTRPNTNFQTLVTLSLFASFEKVLLDLECIEISFDKHFVRILVSYPAKLKSKVILLSFLEGLLLVLHI